MNFFNLLTLRTKKYRPNPCSFYLFVSTIFDSLYLSISIGTRLFSRLHSRPSSLYCKCRTYLVVLCPLISTCFILFGSIDRCLSSCHSHRWRHWSDIRFAHRLTKITLLATFLSLMHVFFYFEIERFDHLAVCVPRQGLYRTLFGIFVCLTSPFLLYSLMLLSTLSTLRRYQRLKNRFQIHRRHHRRRRTSRIDHQLILLIFVQVGLGTFLTFFRSIYLFVSMSNSPSMRKSPERIRLETSIDDITLLIFYLNFIKAFPINFFSSSLYRRVFCEHLQRIFSP